MTFDPREVTPIMFEKKDIDRGLIDEALQLSRLPFKTTGAEQNAKCCPDSEIFACMSVVPSKQADPGERISLCAARIPAGGEGGGSWKENVYACAAIIDNKKCPGKDDIRIL